MQTTTNMTNERIRILYENAFAGNTIVVIGIFILNYIYASQLPTQVLVSWDIYMLSVTILRLSLLLDYKKHSPSVQNHEKYERRYTYASGLTGIGWAFLIYTGMNHPLVVYHFYSLLILAGIVAIASPLFTSSIKTLYFYILPSVIVAIPVLLFKGGNDSVIGFIMIILTFMVLRSSKKIYNIITDTLMLRDQTQTLASDLKQLNYEKSSYEERMQDIMDHSPTAIYVKDLDGRYIFLNQKLADLYNRQREDITGKTLYDFLPEAMADKIRQNDIAVIETGKPVKVEEYAEHADGPHHYISIKFPIFDKEKNLYAVGGVSTDITERVKTEESLRISQQRLLLHREQSPVGIIEWNTNFEFMDWNPAAQHIFGFTKEEVIGKHITDRIIPANDQTTVTKAWDDLLVNKDGTHNISQNVTKDGRTILCEWHNTPLVDSHGNVIAITSMIEDITEQNKNEENLRHTQKMDAIGKLTGGIAHDFNNMLGVIIGFCELLKTRVDNKDKKTLSYTSQILSSAERARMLTSKLLNFSRKIPSYAETVSVNSLLNEMQQILEKSLTPRIELVLNKDENLWPTWLDKTRLEDAILNLCINSMHAMPEGGSLKISTMNSVLKDNDVHNLNISPGEYVLLSVEDNGTGMDEKILKKIFDPFFTTKGTGGTGLGLSQVYGFILQSKGAVQVNSQPGKGTRVTLCFPRATEEEVSLSRNKLPHEDNPAGNETILVVDDEPALIELTKEILTVYNYKVLFAATAEEALDMLKLNSVDLMLTDVIMPGMDGYQLANIVMQQYPHIKIQIVSGFNDDEKIPHANKTLYQQQLHKPYSPNLLLKKVRKLLDEEQVFSD